ncbi:alpha/beta-hydrolase superfamily protein [Forsythia ovata]|uniref:Carboxymethylenebutenolidase homolog n=1 Tax=Forsythia ovata TaxID=205694 RepID=A0ABD1RP07_9LAMI
MGLGSAPPVFSAPPIYKQHYQRPRPVSCVPQLHFPRCKFDPGRPLISFRMDKTNKFKVFCSQVEVEESLSDEACELVNGTEVTIGEGDDSISALLFQAVKNNNSTGILLLSDIFGFEDSSTRDFAYRIACNGYNVLVPDLFHGDPWTKDWPMSYLEQWIAKQNPQHLAKDIFVSAKWMIDEFAAVGISKKLGLIGFCFGGGRVVDILSQDQGTCFGAGVSFYGTRIDSYVASNIKVPLLLIAGDKDPLCPINVLEDIGKRNKESKMVVFKERGHGFAHRPQTPEEDGDAEEAFNIMRNWLHNGLLVQI